MTGRIYNGLSRFFDSVWYPAVYAAVCVISGVNGKAVYVPMACVLATMIILSCFFAKNKRSFIAPVLMSFYCIGVDNQEGFNTSNAQLLAYYDTDGFMMIIAIGVVAAAFLFVRLFRMGVFAKENQGKSTFLWGILLMDAALLLNGIGSQDWQPVNLVYGALFAGVLTFFFFLFRGCLTDSRQDREYVCRITVIMSLIAFAQILIKSFARWQDGTLFLDYYGKETEYITREIADLGWGIVTSVCGVLVLGVPAAMYLATRNRRGWVWCMLSLALIFVSAVFRSRSAIGGAVLFFALGLLVGCFWGENKAQMRFLSAILGTGILIAVVVTLVSEQISGVRILSYIRFDKIFDDNRWDMWATAGTHFTCAPIFGVGFDKGAIFGKYRLDNVFSNMYHGIIPQFYGAMGILGICAFAKHLFDLGKATFRRFSAEKLLLAAVPGMILAMSMVDNFFFYANYQFVYCLFLALIEKTDEKRLAQ